MIKVEEKDQETWVTHYYVESHVVDYKSMFAGFTTLQVHGSLTSNKVVSEVSSHEEFG